VRLLYVGERGGKVGEEEGGEVGNGAETGGWTREVWGWRDRSCRAVLQ
jgi:hypothetical protein